MPKLGLATVYRTLKALIDDGQLLTVGLPATIISIARVATVCSMWRGCPGNLEGLAPNYFAKASGARIAST